MVINSTMYNVLRLYLYAVVALQYPYVIFIIDRLLSLLPHTGLITTWLESVAFDPLCLLMPACGTETSRDTLNLTFSARCSSQRSVALSCVTILGFLLAFTTMIMHPRRIAVRKAKSFPGPGRKGELSINIPPKSPFILEAQFLNEMAKQEIIELDAAFESYVGSPVKISLPSASLSEFLTLLPFTSTADQNTIDWLQQSTDIDYPDDGFGSFWSGDLETSGSGTHEDGTSCGSILSGYLADPENNIDEDGTDVWWQLSFEESGRKERGFCRLGTSTTYDDSSNKECPLLAGQVLENNVSKVCESDFGTAELSSSANITNDRKVMEWMAEQYGEEGLFWDEM